jgi:hypothetical protein
MIRARGPMLGAIAVALVTVILGFASSGCSGGDEPKPVNKAASQSETQTGGKIPKGSKIPEKIGNRGSGR